ncbi:MAG: hypothetical protein LBU15_03415 [Rickettsiales bacterium]|jgi:thymidine kinase|nr:hypothetical protein [Rickettsiales bacterium]
MEGGRGFPVARGKVIFYTGCMFSGKSLNLIRKVREIGGSFECFKPTLDTRDVDVIASRDSEVGPLPARAIDDIREILGSRADLVVLDEIQFFKLDNFREAIDFLRERGKTILMGGLDRIANGKYWEIYPIALGLSDEVVNLTALCDVCGGKATYTRKLAGSDADIDIEGEGVVFVPVCEQCFRSNRRPAKNSPGAG